MKLYQCLSEFANHALGRMELTRIVAASHQVKPGDTFLALPGEQRHGLAFVDQALAQGANLVITPATAQCPQHPLVLPVDDLVARLPALLKAFYELNSSNFSPIGITGTNGKTSCCHFIAQGLRSQGITTGTIGTLGWGIDAQRWFETHHTTPDLVSLYTFCSELVSLGAQEIVMEVSSHALSQGRVCGVPFEIAVMTNVTRDHLDYHGSWDAYAQAKATLLQTPGLKTAVLNQDDPFVKTLAKRLSPSIQCFTYSLNDPSADIVASHCQWSSGSALAKVQTPLGSFDLQTSLVGAFNLSNTLACVGVWLASGYRLDQVAAMCGALKPVPGRMQRVPGTGKQASVYVDYAHTPDALEKALLALKPLTKGRLICVFGCGGDRDQGKRVEMGRVVSKLADIAMITNDNPRNEDPQKIANAVASGFSSGVPPIILPDRAQAIEEAIALASDHDIVLIAGKGHETQQIEAGRTEHFCDVACAQKVIASD